MTTPQPGLAGGVIVPVRRIEGARLDALLTPDVLDGLIELALELLDAIPDTRQIGAEANDDLGHRRGLFDVVHSHATQR